LLLQEDLRLRTLNAKVFSLLLPVISIHLS
jgi:hypothetical protein